MSNLHFTAAINNANFNQVLADMESRIKGFSNKSVEQVSLLDQVFKKLGETARIPLDKGNIEELITNIIKVRGEVQQLETSFAGLLKSKIDANSLMIDIVKAAAETPFDLKEIANGARQMLAYGADSRTVVADIRMLGDVASGVAMPINDLIGLYANLKNSGQASTSHLDTLAAKGIPIYNELAKVLGLGVNRVKELAEAGRISSNDVQKAFANMTAQGGIFEGMMAQQSQTLAGLVGNFKDAVDNMFNELGQNHEGFLASGILMSTLLVENYDKVIKTLLVLTAAYGAYNAALIVPTVFANVKAFLSLATSIKSAAEAQVLFNLISSANPMGLLVAGIAAAIAAYALFSDGADSAAEAQRKFNEVQAEDKKNKEELANKTKALISTIQTETSSRFQQVEAFKELQALYPQLFSSMTLDTLKKKEATEVQKDLNKALDNMSVAKAEKDFKAASAEVLKLEGELKSLQNMGVNGYANLGISNQIASVSYELANAQKQAGLIRDNLKRVKEIAYEANTPAAEQLEHYKEIKENIERNIEGVKLTVSPMKAVGRETNITKQLCEQIRLTGFLKDLDDVNKKIDTANEKLRAEKDTNFSNNLSDAKSTKDLRGLITDASTNNRRDSLVQKTKSMLDSTEKSDPEFRRLQKLYNELTATKREVAPFGSLKYWEEVVSKTKTALSLVTKPDSAATQDLLKKRLDAEFKVAELKLQLDKNYADGSVESYERIAQNARDLMSKISPNDSSFADLLETEMKATETAEMLRKSLAIRNVEEEIEEKKKQYETYNLWVKHLGKEAADEQFFNLKKSGDSFKDYLQANIDDIQKKVEEGTAVPLDLENLLKFKTAFAGLNEGIDGYKQKITAAEKAAGSFTEYLRILKQEQEKIGKSDPQKAGFIAQQIVETEKKRKDLIKDFLTENNLNEEKRLAIQKKYDDLRAGLDQEYADNKSSIYQESLNKINLQEQNAFNELNGGYDDKAKDVEKELSAILESKKRSEIIAFIKDYNAELEKMELVGQAGTNAYNKIGESIEVAKKKLAEIDVENTREVFNILGQVGQELSNADGNLGKFGKSLAEAAKQANLVFTAVKEGAKTTEIITSVTGLVLNLISKIINQRKEEQRMRLADIKAMNEYNILLTERIRLQSIANSNGFTKNYDGQINDTAAALVKATTDYSNAIQAMQNATGPQLAGKPIFGIWGKAVFAPNLTQRVPDLINDAGELNVELAKSLINSEALTEEEKVLLDNAIKTTEALEKVREQGKSIIQDLVGQIANNLRNVLVDAFKSGTSAAEAFGKSVAEIMADVASKLMFDKIMQPVFDRLAKEIDHSLYAPGGDRNVLDDFERYQDYGMEAANAYVEGQKYIQEMVKKATGIDPYADIKDKEGNTLSGSIKSITEETAGVLAGQMNAIRVTQATNLEVNRSQLLALNKIATNSEFLQHLEILKSIDKKLSSGDGLRSAGLDN